MPRSSRENASAEPPRILLLCPEALGAQVMCVEDALRTRGYRVRVEQGRRARRWVRNVPPGSPTLRVLCVSEIDPVFAQRLAQGREDFHIVGVKTPRSVVQQIEQLVGRARPRRRPRPSRMYLAQPTLMEQSLHPSRRWGAAAAAAAVGVLAVGGLLAAMLGGSDTPAPSSPLPLPTMAAQETASPKPAARQAVEEPVLSAVKPMDEDELREAMEEDQ